MTDVLKTVLYVEDDPDDREFFFSTMQQTHPEVHIDCASNGQEALTYLEARSGMSLPDLIVMDLNMPLLDGKRLLRQLSARPNLNHVPVVVFTSSESPEDKDIVRRFGVALVNKPFNLAQMPAILDNLLSYSA
jgi:CheY-like chemotaxis protein